MTSYDSRMTMLSFRVDDRDAAAIHDLAVPEGQEALSCLWPIILVVHWKS